MFLIWNESYNSKRPSFKLCECGHLSTTNCFPPSSVVNMVLSVMLSHVWDRRSAVHKGLIQWCDALDKFTVPEKSHSQPVLIESLTMADPREPSPLSSAVLFLFCLASMAGLNLIQNTQAYKNQPRECFLSLFLFLSFYSYLYFFEDLVCHAAIQPPKGTFIYEIVEPQKFWLFDTDVHEIHYVLTRTNTGDLWRLVCFCAQTQCKKKCEFVCLTNCNQCMSF